MLRLIATVAAALLLAGPAAAAGFCRTVTFDQAPFTVCEVDMGSADVRLFHSDPRGQLYGQFSAIDAALRRQGLRLALAMNAGMYHPDRAPVGLYIEEGEERRGIITSPGPGNFGMLPNGVLCIGKGRARIIESRTFAKNRPACRFATQSGPMLLIGGKLHPRFLPDSTSLYIRNGVGTSADGRRLVLAISDAPVNFHTFARFFRDVADVPDALFLDGNISRLWAPELGRADFGLPMGPVLGVVVPDG